MHTTLQATQLLFRSRAPVPAIAVLMTAPANREQQEGQTLLKVDAAMRLMMAAVICPSAHVTSTYVVITCANMTRCNGHWMRQDACSPAGTCTSSAKPIAGSVTLLAFPAIITELAVLFV